MEELPKAKTSQDCHENFSGHEGAPGKSPPLLHSRDDKGKRSWKDDFEPHMQSAGSHGQSRATIDRRYMAHTSLSGDDHRPESPHDYHEKHRRFCLAEPEQRKRYPADA